MKKIISLLIVVVIAVSMFTVAMINGNAELIGSTPVVGNKTGEALYAHAHNSDDTQAWVKWYAKDDTMYFFMPTSTDKDSIEIYNALNTDVVINGTTIKPDTSEFVNYEENKVYDAITESKTYSLVIMRSSAEAAIFINNTATFDNGMDLWTYLTYDKENSTSADSVILDAEGNIDTTGIKKIKGRGNTSWDADKKGFNLTYTDAVVVGDMQKCKKFSIISNFQDASLARNRVLFDLADEIGVPYASDSRFAEVYVNGEYIGNYQVCEKVDVGKNTLMPDIDDEDYLNYVDGTQTEFEFVCEIDAGPSPDDFTVSASNGNNLTMKAPELDKDDANYRKVRSFIKARYDRMYNKLIENADNINDYIDIESLAQVYLINELGKNWDSGASSFFFVYKPDENGRYKFYASPVWDYDNSLGNAQGVENDLKWLGIDDYEEPTGYFAAYKNGYRGPNFLSDAVDYNQTLIKMIPTVWFEQFVPAIEKKLNGTGINSGEFYSSDVYYELLKKSADMNFIRWDIIQEPQWIADHTELKRHDANFTYNKFGQVTGVEYIEATENTHYDQYVFEAEYNYMIDWLNARVAWLSSQYISDYTPTEIDPGLRGDTDNDSEVSVMDATAIQLYCAQKAELDALALIRADVDDDGIASVMDATKIQKFVAKAIPEL